LAKRLDPRRLKIHVALDPSQFALKQGLRQRVMEAAVVTVVFRTSPYVIPSQVHKGNTAPGGIVAFSCHVSIVKTVAIASKIPFPQFLLQLHSTIRSEALSVPQAFSYRVVDASLFPFCFLYQTRRVRSNSTGYQILPYILIATGRILSFTTTEEPLLVGLACYLGLGYCGGKSAASMRKSTDTHTISDLLQDPSITC